MGIEPTSEAWEASILPLYDARSIATVANAPKVRNNSRFFAILLVPTRCLAFRPQCFCITRTAKLPGFIFPRRSPGAGGSNSADGKKIA